MAVVLAVPKRVRTLRFQAMNAMMCRNDCPEGTREAVEGSRVSLQARPGMAVTSTLHGS